MSETGTEVERPKAFGFWSSTVILVLEWDLKSGDKKSGSFRKEHLKSRPFDIQNVKDHSFGFRHFPDIGRLVFGIPLYVQCLNVQQLTIPTYTATKKTKMIGCTT